MDRRLQHRKGRQVDEGAVLDEGRVERRQRVALVIGVVGQLPPHQLRPLGERGRQAADERPTGAGGLRGELRPVAAVDEHQADSRVLEGPAVEPLKPCLRGGLETHLGERSKARVLPLLVLRGGKSQLREAGKSRLAERADRAAPGPLVEEREARAKALNEVRHGAASGRPSPGA